jgi:hypothetical protein
MADWSNVLNELAGRACASIDDLIASTEFRDFCGDGEVSKARKELLARRNDEAHQRRVEDTQLGAALDEVVGHLEVLLRALSFWLDNPLVIAKSLRWDSLENTGSLSYRRLAGDHPIVQMREMKVDSPVIELDSLYLLYSNRNLHLVRPFLIGTNCQRCGTFSIFHIDRFLNGSLTLKSLEHGHTIDASEQFSRAVRATGLLATESG